MKIDCYRPNSSILHCKENLIQENTYKASLKRGLCIPLIVLHRKTLTRSGDVCCIIVENNKLRQHDQLYFHQICIHVFVEFV
jgi:hypothetical protein